MDYANQQLSCVTCDRWSGKRVATRHNIVRSDTMSCGLCKGGANNNFNTHPGSGSGCNSYIRWVALKVIQPQAALL